METEYPEYNWWLEKLNRAAEQLYKHRKQCEEMNDDNPADKIRKLFVQM